MVHAVLVLLVFLSAVAALSLAFLSQGYWFARAWKVAGGIDRAEWRKAARGVLIAALAMIAIVSFAAVTSHARGVISRGSWGSSAFGVWLIGSIFSYLLIKVVAGAQSFRKRLRAKSSSDGSAVPAAPPTLAVA